MKDDSVANAVLTEQGSSASQMTAAKVMNVIARLHECDGQAADAISACTQVKMEDAKKNVWKYGYVFHDINGRSRILLFNLKQTYTDTHSQDSCHGHSSKKH